MWFFRTNPNKQKWIAGLRLYLLIDVQFECAKMAMLKEILAFYFPLKVFNGNTTFRVDNERGEIEVCQTTKLA